MKKILSLMLVVGMSVTMMSCFTYTTKVGKGAQGNTEVSAWNHYVVYGLAPVGLSDPKVLADGATDYDVTVTHTFVNGLIQGITFGLYTPTTTIVKK